MLSARSSFLFLALVLSAILQVSAVAVPEGGAIAQKFLVENNYIVLGPFPPVMGYLPQELLRLCTLYGGGFVIGSIIAYQMYRVVRG